MAELSVGTYNAHSCIGADGIYSVDRIAGVVRPGGADVVCLQEVEVNCDGAPWGSTSTRTLPPIKTRIWSEYHADDQAASIAALAGYEHHVFAPAIRSRASSKWQEEHDYVSDADVSGNFSDERWKADLSREESDGTGTGRWGKFGIAILSKHPILEVRIHRFKRYKGKTLRNALACLVRLPNDALVWIVNTHLGCHFVGREQQQQAKELVGFIDALATNATVCGRILCGDFNSLPYFTSIRTICKSGFIDVWQPSGHGVGGTFPSHARVVGMPSFATKCLRVLRLDYFFLSTGIVCKCIYVHSGDGCSMASDHLPLCAVFYVGETSGREEHSQKRWPR